MSIRSTGTFEAQGKAYPGAMSGGRGAAVDTLRAGCCCYAREAATIIFPPPRKVEAVSGGLV